MISFSLSRWGLWQMFEKGSRSRAESCQLYDFVTFRIPNQSLEPGTVHTK